MKYCIYAGAIYSVMDGSGKLLSLTGPLGNETVLQDQVVEIPEEVYLRVKDEYEDAVRNLTNVEHRIWRLNDEYYKKHSALQEIRTEAGRKEKEIISRALRQIDKA